MGPAYPATREISLRFSRAESAQWTFDVRVAATRPREYVLLAGDARSESRASARVGGLYSEPHQLRDARPNAVVSGKAAAQRGTMRRDEDCARIRHAWEEAADYPTWKGHALAMEVARFISGNPP